MENAETIGIYKRLFDNAPLPYMSLGIDSRVIDVNAECANLLGCSVKMATGRNVADYIVAESRDRFWEYMKSLQNGVDASDVELAFCASNGSRVDVSMRGQALRSEKGNIDQFCCILTDITKDKRINDAFKQGEEKYRDLVNNLNIGIYRTTGGDTGQFLQVNSAMADMFGYESVESLRRVDVSSLYSDPALRLEFIREVTESGFVKNKEHLLKKKDGTLFTAISTATAQIDESGNIKWIDGILKDITERKIAEEQLKESEERYRAIFETVAEGILITDIDTCEFKYANPAICEMLGYDIKEFLSMNLGDIHPEESCDLVEGAVKAQADGQKKVISELACLRKDGSTIYVDMRMTRVSVKGKVLAVGFFSDVTIRRHAEQQKEQMIQVDKMVALGTLVSGVAHEINNPTNFITLNAPILSESWQSVLPILDEYYEKNGDFAVGGLEYSEMRDDIPLLFSGIAEGSNRIKNIVNDLKDFARISSGEEEGGVSLNEVVHAALKLLYSQLRETTKNLKTEYDDKLPEIRANFRKLEQVVVNLVQNACHALNNMDQSITISTGYDKKADEVFVEVVDEGQGMSEEVVSQIMNPFFTTKRDSGGTGLGLSVSHGIIKDHNGRLTFSSKEGEGTTATVMLPVAGGE